VEKPVSVMPATIGDEVWVFQFELEVEFSFWAGTVPSSVCGLLGSLTRGLRVWASIGWWLSCRTT
jgi:hypothetical protein